MHNPKKEMPALDWLNDAEIEAGFPRYKPATALQALMDAAPYTEPVSSIEEMTELFDIVRGAIESLHSDDQMLIEAIVFERMSFRGLEARYNIPKSIIHRRYAAAILELRGLLIEYPLIVEYLDGSVR